MDFNAVLEAITGFLANLGIDVNVIVDTIVDFVSGIIK